MDIEEQNDRHRVLVALGKFWKPKPRPKAQPWSNLSFESKITARAAHELLEGGHTDSVIFSAGKTARFTDVSEAEAMRDYAGFDTDDPRVSIEEMSRDTRGSAANVKEMLDRFADRIRKDLETSVMTVGYHSQRSGLEYRKADVDVSQILSSEEVMREYGGHMIPYLDRYQGSAAEWFWRFRELISWALYPVPRGIKKIPLHLWRGGLAVQKEESIT